MKGWAQKTFASMTLEQKLGQLMVSFLDDEGDIRELARAGALGGLYSVAGRTVREAAEWVADIQQEAAIPLLLCSDFETGSTFAGGTPLPSPMAVGATGDAELAREAGRVTAREVGAIGFRFMGSPVVDINRRADRGGRMRRHRTRRVACGRSGALKTRLSRMVLHGVTRTPGVQGVGRP